MAVTSILAGIAKEISVTNANHSAPYVRMELISHVKNALKLPIDNLVVIYVNMIAHGGVPGIKKHTTATERKVLKIFDFSLI